jgi:myosin-5
MTGAAGKAAPTVAAQFKESLKALSRSLERAQLHYIRCVKPNASSAADQWDGAAVLRQLACSGVLEALQVRQQGYAVRWELATFLARFGCLADGTLDTVSTRMLILPPRDTHRA